MYSYPWRTEFPSTNSLSLSLSLSLSPSPFPIFSFSFLLGGKLDVLGGKLPPHPLHWMKPWDVPPLVKDGIKLVAAIAEQPYQFLLCFQQHS